MNVFAKVFQTLRSWLGLADQSDSHMVPSHGWLNASVVDARQARKDSDERKTKALEGSDRS